MFRNGTNTKRVQLDEQLSSRYERIWDAESGTEVLRFRQAEDESGTEVRLQAPASALVLSLSLKAGHVIFGESLTFMIFANNLVFFIYDHFIPKVKQFLDDGLTNTGITVPSNRVMSS